MTLTPAPNLIGLVLAGGNSRRMGADKGELRYRGVAQARYFWELLSGQLGRCYVSVNAGQRTLDTYADLPLIVDSEPRQGPATGLLAAYEAEPEAAWLVAAVDLVRIDGTAVSTLIRGRQSTAAATAMRHEDGTIEPYFAIWEPRALALLAARVAEGDTSARRCLESIDVDILGCPGPQVLESVNSPSEREALLSEIYPVT